MCVCPIRRCNITVSCQSKVRKALNMYLLVRTAKFKPVRSTELRKRFNRLPRSMSCQGMIINQPRRQQIKFFFSDIGYPKTIHWLSVGSFDVTKQNPFSIKLESHGKSKDAPTNAGRSTSFAIFAHRNSTRRTASYNHRSWHHRSCWMFTGWHLPCRLEWFRAQLRVSVFKMLHVHTGVSRPLGMDDESVLSTHTT